MAQALKGQIRYPHADGTVLGPSCVMWACRKTR